ncbi:MAG: DUF3726 domain-containing protein [Chloroflexota bacterium]
MVISHNEIVVGCLKAFEALGLPKGQREDAAEAIGWLALHGQPFEQSLAQALDTLRPDKLQAKLLSQSGTASVWDARGGSALAIFPNLVDYALVKAKATGQHRLTVIHSPDIDLIWPYLDKTSSRLPWIECRWRVAENEEMLVDFREDGGRIYHFQKQSALRPREFELVVKRSESIAVRQIDDVILRVEIHSDWFQQKLKQTQEGIRIDAKLWQNLVALGKGILVESTEESERRGAGGV